MVAKRRLITDIGDRIVTLPAEQCVRYVDAGFGQLLFDGREVKRGNCVLSANAQSRNDGSARRKRSSQQSRGFMDFSIGKEFTNTCARDSVASHSQHRDHFDTKAFLMSQLFQNFRITGLAVSKTEIRSHMNRQGSQRIHQNMTHKLEWRLAGKLTGKRQDHEEVDPSLLDELNLAPERREHLGGMIRRK